MSIHTTQSHHGDRPIEVHYHPSENDPGYEVQVFLGTSYASIYMDVGTARAFAEQILAVVPAPAPAVEDYGPIEVPIFIDVTTGEEEWA